MKSVSASFNSIAENEQQFRYACYCFSLLLNSTHLDLSGEYFRQMCIVFLSPFKSEAVEQARKSLNTALNNRPETKDDLDELLKSIKFTTRDNSENLSKSETSSSEIESEIESEIGKL